MRPNKVKLYSIPRSHSYDGQDLNSFVPHLLADVSSKLTIVDLSVQKSQLHTFLEKLDGLNIIFNCYSSKTISLAKENKRGELQCFSLDLAQLDQDYGGHLQSGQLPHHLCEEIKNWKITYPHVCFEIAGFLNRPFLNTTTPLVPHHLAHSLVIKIFLKLILEHAILCQ